MRAKKSNRTAVNKQSEETKEIKKTQETNKNSEINEEEEIDFDKIEKIYANAVLKSGKKENEGKKEHGFEFKISNKEKLELLVSIVIVVVLAVIFFNFTDLAIKKKSDISQITGEHVEITTTSAVVSAESSQKESVKEDKIKTETTTASDIKSSESTTAAAVYKEEITTLQALNSSEEKTENTMAITATGAKVIGKYYVLHLSTYKKLDKAKKDIEYMSAKGYQAYYVVEGKSIYRVILNIIFTTREDAETFGKKLKSKKVINAYNIKVMENKN